MTAAALLPVDRRAAGRAVRLVFAVFLLVCAWATTHFDEAGGHHEGTAHSAITVGSLTQADGGDAPDAALVPPVDTDATSIDAPDGSTDLVLLLLAAVACVLVGVRPFAASGPRPAPPGPPPPPRHPLSLSGISRI